MTIYIAATYNKKYRYAEYIPADTNSGTSSDLQEKGVCEDNLSGYGLLFPGQFCIFYEGNQLTYVASENHMVSLIDFPQSEKYFAGYINDRMPYDIKSTYSAKKDILSVLDTECPNGLSYSQDVSKGINCKTVARVVNHLLMHKITLICSENISDAIKIMRASLLALPIRIANRGHFCTAVKTSRFSDYIKDINIEETKDDIQFNSTPFFVGCVTTDEVSGSKFSAYIVDIDDVECELLCATPYANHILKYNSIPYSTVHKAPYNSIEKIGDFNAKVTSLELKSRCVDALNRIDTITTDMLIALFQDYYKADRQGKIDTKDSYVKIANRLIFSKKLISLSSVLKNFFFDDSISFEELGICCSVSGIANLLNCTEDKKSEDNSYIKSIFELVTNPNIRLYDEVRNTIISFLTGAEIDEHISHVFNSFIHSIDEDGLNTYSKLIPIGSNTIIKSMIVDAITKLMDSESKQKAWIKRIKRDMYVSDDEKANRNCILCASLEQYLSQNQFYCAGEWNPSSITVIFELADVIQFNLDAFNVRRAEIDGQLSSKGAKKYFETLIGETQSFPNPKQRHNEGKRERHDSFPYGAIIPVILLFVGIIIYACTEGCSFELIGTILFNWSSNFSRAILIEIPIIVSVIACAFICIAEREEDYSNRLRRVFIREIIAVAIVIAVYILSVYITTILLGIK